MRWAEVFKINSDMTKPLNTLMNEINTAIQNKVQSHGNGVEQRFNNVDTNVGNVYQKVDSLTPKTTTTFGTLVTQRGGTVSGNGCTIMAAFIAPTTGIYQVKGASSEASLCFRKLLPDAPAYGANTSYYNSGVRSRSVKLNESSASIVANNRVGRVLDCEYDDDSGNTSLDDGSSVSSPISNGLVYSSGYIVHGYFYAIKGEPVVITCETLSASIWGSMEIWV